MIMCNCALASVNILISLYPIQWAGAARAYRAGLGGQESLLFDKRLRRWFINVTRLDSISPRFVGKTEKINHPSVFYPDGVALCDSWSRPRMTLLSLVLEKHDVYGRG